MKRVHLFEFEDLKWFPNWIRICMTRLITVMHKKFNTSEDMANLLAKLVKQTNRTKIIDLCSGSGGPMLDTISSLKNIHKIESIELLLTDLYPNLEDAKRINEQNNHIHYRTNPLDATNIDNNIKGILTMVGSFHHMKPDLARKILIEVQNKKQPICIMEINKKFPIALWWLFIPLSAILCLFITPMVKPLTVKQIIFTYIIPIIPICFAWDAVITSGRIYRMEDLDILLKGLGNENYTWEKGIIEGKSEKIYLIGCPK
ncbi:hypothetical protein [Tenacibaculum sp. 190524A02b]|uniref:Methyltransferase domain-containing protein n=1 Tax=Tenacibaculum vairaonense TaxID=3137860 RepID=A0ABM9PMA8_9FLAO